MTAAAHPHGNYGPSNGLAQSWTPPFITRALWGAMVEAGFHPQRHPVVHDLAAGYGRLIEDIAPFCRLVLNDVDPALTRVLKERFPSATVYTMDLRQIQPGPIKAAVGSPPWIEVEDTYLPQSYVSMISANLQPGGVFGALLPDWMMPDTDLQHVRTIRFSEADIQQHAPHIRRDWVERPVISIWRR